MHCPFCRHPDSRVVDSRDYDDGAAIRRRRACPECGRRFTTVETASLSVMKRSGATEPFSRTKVVAGVRKACEGRPVSEDALALLALPLSGRAECKGEADGRERTAGTDDRESRHRNLLTLWLAGDPHQAHALAAWAIRPPGLSPSTKDRTEGSDEYVRGILAPRRRSS